MLSSNSKPNPQQPRFRILRICFCPIIRPQNKKIFLPKPIFPAEMLANPPIMLTLRNCKLRKRPPIGSSKLQVAKPSSRRERQIAGCENVLLPGAANCRLRKRPPAGSNKLQAAKSSSRWERQIASCETVLPSGAANCSNHS